ncbi:MAG: hypothetical protein ACYDCN_01960 [Bacteroidia bacterium]
MKGILIYLLSLFTLAINAQDTILIPTQKIDFKTNCFNVKKDGLMSTEEEFKSNLIDFPNNKRCKDYILPTFDFSITNLLWFHTGSNTVPKSETFLYKIPSKKKYFFLIKLTYYLKDNRDRYKDCIDENTHAVAIFFDIKELTPKFEKGYTFEYAIEKKSEYLPK